jgi:carboxyl-terminal processing protease
MTRLTDILRGTLRDHAARILLATGALFIAGCATSRPTNGPGLSDRERRLNVESFDVAWRTVRDRHWDPALGGVDWDLVRDEYRPRIARAASLDEARQLIDEALLRLRQSHCGIVPADLYDDMACGSSSQRGDVGFRVRVLAGRALVVSVRADTPAAHLGVQPGWELLAVGGTPLAPRLARVAAEYGSSTLSQLMLTGAIVGLLVGPIGETVVLDFADGDDHTHRVAFERIAPRGEPATVGGMPITYVWFESRRVADGVGYIAFNAFLDPDRTMSQFEQAICDLADTRGIILDLRGNAGGIGGMAMGVAGWFVERADHPLGTMRLRDVSLRFAVFPRPEPYLGRLAILVDGETASTAEILAGGLQDLGRARIFGERTAGAALPSLFLRLPNGDGLQYPYADYFSAGGERLEGVGVQPDVTVQLTRAALLAGRDLALEAAIAWIRRDGNAPMAIDNPAAADLRRTWPLMENSQ